MSFQQSVDLNVMYLIFIYLCNFFLISIIILLIMYFTAGGGGGPEGGIVRPPMKFK